MTFCKNTLLYSSLHMWRTAMHPDPKRVLPGSATVLSVFAQSRCFTNKGTFSVHVTDQNEEDEGRGCILAHAMGLGKSIQTIAMLHTYHAYFPGHRSLLIVPANVLGNWKEEFSKWLPPALPGSQQLIDKRVGCTTCWNTCSLAVLGAYDLLDLQACSFRQLIDHILGLLPDATRVYAPLQRP